jgi:probable UDP-sugar transporter A4
MAFKLFNIFKYTSWSVLIIVQVISYGSYTILVHLCEENGMIKFHSSSVNFIIEFLKLFLSLLCYFFEFFIKRIRINSHSFKNLFYSLKEYNFNNSFKEYNYDNQKLVKINIDDYNSLYLNRISNTQKKLKSKNIFVFDSLSFAVPAFLYFVNNNLAVYIQLFMDSTSYQMMSNLKIFSTAILYYLIIGKSLTKIKWISLFLLFFAGLFYSFANIKSIENYYLDESDLQQFFNQNDKTGRVIIEQKSEEKLNLDRDKNSITNTKMRPVDQIYITDVGFLLMIIYCFISGLSGVYNEYLLKLNFKDSIFVQNIYLYIYGCLFNFLYVLFQMKSYEYSNDNLNIFENFFKGFNYFTWTIIMTQVFNGFLMSFLMKYSNNITRLFVISSSLIITTFLSVLIFSLKLNLYFYFCFIAIMFALYFYLI